MAADLGLRYGSAVRFATGALVFLFIGCGSDEDTGRGSTELQDAASPESDGAAGMAGSGSGGQAAASSGGSSGSSSGGSGGSSSGGSGASAGSGGASSGCGLIGTTCSATGDCGSELECESGVCSPPSTGMCGGFAGAECTSGVCLYCSGCDFGPCFTSDAIACLCSTPGGRAAYVCN